MRLEPCIPSDCSIVEAAYRAYTLQAIARESLREFGQIARLPPGTRLGEDLGITIDGRMRIISRLRQDSGAQLAEPALPFPTTLGELLQIALPRVAIGYH